MFNRFQKLHKDIYATAVCFCYMLIHSNLAFRITFPHIRRTYTKKKFVLTFNRRWLIFGGSSHCFSWNFSGLFYLLLQDIWVSKNDNNKNKFI